MIFLCVSVQSNQKKTIVNNDTKSVSIRDITHKQTNDNNRDVNDNMFTRKVDLDYIPGLDDELKVILPGK